MGGFGVGGFGVGRFCGGGGRLLRDIAVRGDRGQDPGDVGQELQPCAASAGKPLTFRAGERHHRQREQERGLASREAEVAFEGTARLDGRVGVVDDGHHRVQVIAGAEDRLGLVPRPSDLVGWFEPPTDGTRSAHVNPPGSHTIRTRAPADPRASYAHLRAGGGSETGGAQRGRRAGSEPTCD